MYKGRQKTTGSIILAKAFTQGHCLTLALIGLTLLAASAVVHANVYHIMASLAFAVCIGILKVLGTVDRAALKTPWHRIVRVTDVLSLLVLGTATFSPLIIVASHGHPGWDFMVLGGILLIWWNVLDRLVADYRKVFGILAAMALAWLPVTIWHPPTWEIAYAVGATAFLATVNTAWVLVSSLRSENRRQYRIIDLEKPQR